MSELADPPVARQFTRDVLWVAGALVVVAVAGAAWAVITARGLGPGDRGNLSLVSVAVMLGSIGCSVGAHYTLPPLLGERRFETGELLGAIVLLGTLLNTALVVVAASLGATLAPEAIYAVLVFALVALLPASWTKTMLSGLFAAHRDFRRMFWAGLLGQTLQVAGGIALLASDRLTLETAVAANVVGAVATVALLTHWTRRTTPLRTFRPTVPSVRRVISAGLAAQPGILAQSLNYRLDVFLIASLGGAEVVGVYVIAVFLSEIIVYPSSIVAQVLLPRAAQQSDAGGAEPAYRIALTAAIVIGATLWFTAPHFVGPVFGPGFLEASPGVRALIPGALALSLWQLAAFELAGRGKIWVMSLSALVGVAITLLGDVLLVPEYGTRGAAVATSIGYLATALVVLQPVRSVLGYRLRDLLVPRPSDLRLLIREVRALRMSVHL